MKDARIEGPPNILFIIVDAVRSTNLSCYGYSKKTSPNIDDLAKEGVLFEDAYSCTIVTDGSLTTIFSGKYPLSHGIITHGIRVQEEDIKQLNERKIVFLPEILKSKGYTTLAVDWLGRWHQRGYDYYSGMIQNKSWNGFPNLRIENLLNMTFRQYARLKKSTIIDEATLVTKQAKNLIKKNLDKKFFLFLHYWDPHYPYAPPTRYYKKIAKQSVKEMFKQVVNPANWIKHRKCLNKLKKFFGPLLDEARISRYEAIARYDASIVYVDHEIGRLMKFLKTHGILNKTLIILTSDHGESLVEHEIFWDHHGLYDVTIHVPLIFRHPELPRNKKIKGFVQHFDITPTILGLLNMEKENFLFDGKSLTPLIYNETNTIHSAIYAEEAFWERKRAIRTRNWKYIYALSKEDAVCRHCKTLHGGNLEELYDLKKDPEENKNIAKQKPNVTKELACALRKKVSEWNKTGASG